MAITIRNQEPPAEAATEVAIVVERETALSVLTDKEQFEAFYAKVKAEVDAHIPDVTTGKGRAAIASLAHKVTKTKTAIDAAGKALTEDARKQIATVDASRREIRNKLDALRDEARRPLDEWEAAEEERKAEAARQFGELKAAAVVTLDDTAATVEARLDDVRGRNLDPTLFGTDFDLAKQQQDDAVTVLGAALTRLRQEEADRAELERLRQEAAEREAREAQAKAEAEAAEAALKAQEAAERAERERLEQAERDRVAAEERAAEERRQAEEKAEADRQAAAARAAREAEERAAEEQRRRDHEHEQQLAAERRRADEAERARQAEADRIAAEKRERAEEEQRQRDLQAKREADVAHRSTIMTAVKTALIEHCTLSEDSAKDVVRAISSRLIPYTAIDFAQQLDLKAAPGRCEEASALSGERYIPCNAPAESMVGWPARGEGPYRMCAGCADHNVKNRGATLVGPFVAEAA